MYYLFIYKQKDLDKYKEEFERSPLSIKQGTTPVFCEMRQAKTNLIESVPYNIICGSLLILGTVLLNLINLNDVISIALVLIVNSICGAVANYIFTIIKHRLRLKLCDKLGVERNEHSIAVMESMEYQSV